MGLFDTFSTPNAIQAPKLPLTDLTQNSNQAQSTVDNVSANNKPTSLHMQQLYSPVASNWYAAKPYGFRFIRRDGSSYVMFLPISPSNITITTSFATNVIPTLYGTVEEHSDVRYYDIVIEGTTGMVPKFVYPIASNDEFTAFNAAQSPGRAKFPISSSGILGGFFSQTIGQINNLLDQAGKAVTAVGGLFGANAPKQETGVYTDQTGFLAFHNLARFLLAYKKDTVGLTGRLANPQSSGPPDQTPYTTHPLTFFNYKDGNEYSVAIDRFILRRSAENPLMYNYQIAMRGYNLRSAGLKLQATEDLTQRLADLGLNGIKPSTLLTSIKNISNAGKAVVGSFSNGVNLFGR